MEIPEKKNAISELKTHWMSLTAVWNEQKTMNFKTDQQKVSNLKKQKKIAGKMNKAPRTCRIISKSLIFLQAESQKERDIDTGKAMKKLWLKSSQIW